MNRLNKVFILIIVLGISINSYSQADTLMKFCSANLTDNYISDGQQYISLLNGTEVAEFKATFYGGSTYRITACSGLRNGNLIFSVYDKNRKELFSNRDYKNSPFWDFKFISTMECIIEAQLSPNGPTSGFALLLIGFKQN